MSKSPNKKKVNVDKNPDSYYEYIIENNEIWYENIQGKGDQKQEPYILARVTSKDVAKRLVTLSTGDKVEFYQTLQVVNDKSINVNDMANVKDINEVDLLYNLWNRLKEKKTFTNVGPTLLIVNPFTRIEGVYNDEVLEHFIEKQEREPPETRQCIDEPHLYDLVLIAIKELLKPNSKNQALVISGESGAGKTEAAKNCMECITHYFTKLAGGSKSDSNDIPLERKILNCNPILEAFGNAKTVRNDNSSRFGKYVKIKLDPATNVITGAEITAYLLEKSRISELTIKERNYHVFYFLLSCGDDKLLSELHLCNDPKKYKYLNTGSGQIMTVPTINDKELFDELKSCFESTGFTDEEIKTIFKVVAAVLLLGNVNMEVKNDKLVIEPKMTFEHICTLIDVDSTKLATVLSRKPPMFGTKEYGGHYTSKLIKSYKDALAKELYNRLFFWIITKLNNKLDSSHDSECKYIGLLDIFGFECFDKNSLEQLCINYTNEQLQQLYIKDIFESDKAEFRREGLESKVHLLDATYKDNKDIIRLIKVFFDRSKDVKADVQIYDVVAAFDKEIESKKDKAFSKVKENKFLLNRIKKDIFVIEHTAKNVEYSIDNFVEKNKDETKAGVIDTLLDSGNLIIQMIFTNTTTEEEKKAEHDRILEERVKPDANKIKMRYLGTKFKLQMSQLKTELKLCDHHYIRCLKPNEEKKALLFFPNFVFNQIQYLGVLATIQVRKTGFPIRRYYKDFVENFKLVTNLGEKGNDELLYYQESSKKIIDELTKDKNIANIEDLCLYGKNKIYMKQNFSSLLEIEKGEKLKSKINGMKIMKCAVNYLKKMDRIIKIRKEIDTLQKFFISNRSKIKLQRKKENIKKIQAMYHTHNAVNKIKKEIKNITTIQNSIRMLNAKKIIERKQSMLQFLSLRLQIFNSEIKKRTHEKMRQIAYNILITQITRERIVNYELNNMWTKLNPFFTALIVRKKFKDITAMAKKAAINSQLSSVLSNFQMSLLFRKVQLQKKKMKVIYINATKEMFRKYYNTMITNTLIIQKYLRVIIDKREAVKKISKLYLDDDSGNTMTDILSLYDTALFPNKQKNTDTSIQENNEINDFNCTVNSINVNSRNKILSGSPTKQFSVMSQKTIFSSYKKSRNKLKPTPTIIDEIPLLTKSKQVKLNVYSSYTKPSTLNPTQSKIPLFAKILDIDIPSTTSNNEIYDKPWCEEFNNISKMNLYNKTPIQLIYTSNTHTVCINSRGHVFSFGWNNHGQCGQNLNKSYIDFVIPEYNNRNPQHKYPTLPIINYSSSDKPIPPPSDSKILNAIAGDDFTIVLDKEGNAFGFGDNSQGQLGYGHNMNSSHSTKHVPKIMTLGNIITDYGEVQSVASTENMNMLLTKSNELYIWYNSTILSLIKPRRLYLDKKIKIEQISCGKNFMILLSKNGILYSSGTNTMGELGLDNYEENRISPEEITAITSLNERIVQIRCGYKHSVCVSSSGSCFTWGNNTYGQLGHGDKENFKISIVPEEFGKIIQVAAGFRSTIIMNERRDIFYFGVLSEENKNLNGERCKFDLRKKNLEVANDDEFCPVRLLTAWNKGFSIFYATFADVREVMEKARNKNKVNDIINTLSINWYDQNVEAPYIPNIARYFSPMFMNMNNGD